jgi:hypothetical protein
MSKHLADHRSPSDGGRAKNFVAVERKSGAEGSHPASQEVTRRAKDRNDGRRMQEFLRIDRDQLA